MNPYKILSVNNNVSNKEVIQAVALAMRDRKYSTKEIAQAQQILLNPVTRATSDFLYFVDLGTMKKQLLQEINQTSETRQNSDSPEPFSFEYLPLFEDNHD